MTESEELKAIRVIADQFKAQAEELKGKASNEDIKRMEATLKELKDGIDKDKITEAKFDEYKSTINGLIDKFNAQVMEVREEQARLKDRASNTGKGNPLVSKEQLKAFIEETFKDGSKVTHRTSIEMKAPETFGTSTFFTGIADSPIDPFTGVAVDPRFYERKRKRNLILDHFNILSVEAPKLYYMEKIEVGDTNPTSGDPGTAGWIASGAAKPKRSFRVGTGTVEAKKIAIFGEVEDKLLRDVSSLENWIMQDFMAEMMEQYNDGLLNNDPGVDEDAPLGIKTNAITFTATDAFALQIEAANYIDAIIAAAAYQDSLKEEPSKAFVSKDVHYAIRNLKATDGKYLNNNLVYVNNNGQIFIAGIEVVKVDAEDVPSTHLLMIAEDPGFVIRNYGSLVMERGLNGENFREDKTSFRGYQEVLSYIPTQRENSVLYDTWANIFTAIETPVAP